MTTDDNNLTEEIDLNNDSQPGPRLVSKRQPGRLDANSPPELPHQSAHDLWVAPGDDMYSLAIDRSGGVPLFALPEAQAQEMLMHWFRFHRARYRAAQDAQKRRSELHSVPDGGSGGGSDGGGEEKP